MGFEQKGISKVASGPKVFDDVLETALEVFLTQPLPLEEQVEGLQVVDLIHSLVPYDPVTLLGQQE